MYMYVSYFSSLVNNGLIASRDGVNVGSPSANEGDGHAYTDECTCERTSGRTCAYE